MDLRAMVSLAFRCMSGFASLFILVALGLAAYNLHFSLTADVRPGEFLGYHTVNIRTRVRDSSGYSSERVSEEYRPSFRYTAADGGEHTVEDGDAHVFRYHDPGDAVDVLVDPGGDREPLIDGFVSLYGDSVGMTLIAAIFVFFAEFARRKVLRMFGSGASMRALGERLKAAAGEPEAAPGTSPAGAAPAQGFAALRAGLAGAPAEMEASGAGASGEMRTGKRGGGGARWIAMLALLAVFGMGAFVWFGADGPPPTPVVDTIPVEAAPDYANLPPPVIAPEEEPQSEAPAVAAAAPRVRSEPSAVEKAARAGDAAQLAQLLDAGGDLADVRPAMVKTMVAKGDVDTLRVLFAHGFDLSQHYARQTFGDQAVSARKAEVVRLVREYDGAFDAPAEFVALAAGDLPALRAALATASGDNRWRGQTIDSYARHPEAKTLLEQARAP